MKRAYWKDLFLTIEKGKKRFFSIFFITLLGVTMMTGIFAGCRDLRYAADKFLDEQNLYDIQIVSTYGLTEDDLNAIRGMDEVERAEGVYSETVLVETEKKQQEAQIRALHENGLSEPSLVDGALPEDADEIAVTENFLKDSGAKIGDQISLKTSVDANTEDASASADVIKASEDNIDISFDESTFFKDESSEILNNFTYTITGTIVEPTSLMEDESASSFRSADAMEYFFYVAEAAVESDVYTSIELTVAGARDLNCFSDEYSGLIRTVKEKIENEIAKPREKARLRELQTEAHETLAEARENGEREIADAEEKIADAKTELAEGRDEIESGWRELRDGEDELKESEALMEDELASGYEEIYDGYAQIEAAEDEVASSRAKTESARAQIETAEDELSSGKEELNSTKRETNAQIASGRAGIEEGRAQIAAQRETIETQRAELMAQREELTAQREELKEQSAQLLGQKEELEAKKAELKEEKAQMELQRTGYGAQSETSEAKTNGGLAQIYDGPDQSEVSLRQNADALTQIDEAIAQIKDAMSQIDDSLAQIDDGITQIDDGITQIDDGITQIDDGLAQIDDGLLQLASGDAEIDKAEALLDAAEDELDAGKAEADAQFAAAEGEIEEGLAQIDKSKAELDEGEAALIAGQTEIDKNRSLLDAGLIEAKSREADARSEIAAAYAEIEDVRDELLAGEREMADGEAEIKENEALLIDARDKFYAQIADAEDEIAGMDETSWYVNDRSAIGSFGIIESDADSISAIGTVFPLLFLAVAILITLTAITRMVEEQRGIVGIYKALGYGDGAVYGKYLFYTQAAALLGAAAGNIGGFIVVPKIMTLLVFSYMYKIPEFPLYYYIPYGIGAAILFLAAAAGSAAFACRNELIRTPADLMRPKAPKAGARILMERIVFIWSRTTFLHKVTMRNLFRYKKRFFMTVFGIMGCTALVLVGMSIKNSVTDLMPRQYDYIYQYDTMAVALPDDIRGLRERLDADNYVDEYMDLMVSNITLVNDSKQEEETVQIYVLPEGESFSGYIRLEDEDGNKIVPGEGIVATENLSDVMSFKVGDVLTIQTADLDESECSVGAIVKNYLGNAVYVTQDYYEEHFSDFEVTAALIKLSDECKDPIAYADELKGEADLVSCVSIQNLKDNYSDAFGLINAVVVLIIVLAAALAFVVLFTLQTTNISERERELATIKVLGFLEQEVHQYLNKETLILTAIGILLGLPVGRFFAGLLTSVLKMPAVYFHVSVRPWSYIFAAALTLGFAFLVNQITNRALDRINMVRALKSVE